MRPFIQLYVMRHDDFIVIESNLSLLKAEWKEFKSQFPPSDLILVKELCRKSEKLRQDDLNREEATQFVLEAIKDISVWISSFPETNPKMQQIFFILFMTIAKILKIPFTHYETRSTVKILESLNNCLFEFLEFDFIYELMIVFSADYISYCDRSPFLELLVKFYRTSASFTASIRKTIEDIFLKNRNSAQTLAKMLFSSFIIDYESFSKKSQTMYFNSQAQELMNWIDHILIINEFVPEQNINIQIFLNDFMKNILIGFKQCLPFNQYHTIILFFQHIKFNPLIDLVIQHCSPIIHQNFEKWRNNSSYDALKLCHAMIKTRKPYIIAGFFYSNQMNFRDSEVYGFPDPIYIGKCTEFKYQPPIEDSNHYEKFYSVLPFILHLYKNLWDLPPEAEKCLLTLIEGIGQTRTKSGFIFCFTPGYGICYETVQLYQSIPSPTHENTKSLLEFGFKMYNFISNYQFPISNI